jgi:hypothetical protein
MDYDDLDTPSSRRKSERTAELMAAIRESDARDAQRRADDAAIIQSRVDQARRRDRRRHEG